MLNWIILKENSTTISRIQKGDYLPNHCTITWTHKVEKQQMENTIYTSRNLKFLNNENFASDLAEKLFQLSNIDSHKLCMMDV